MALKIKQNGEVKDLIIPACGVEVLDMEDNFGSSNLEEVLQELGDSDSVYISDETPDKDGIWISSDNTSTVAQENPILVELKDYVNEKTDEIKTTVDSINDKMSEYYSLKDAKAIPENADLNDYVEFGNYQCESGNRATTLSNCPYTAGGFVLHVERTTGGMDDYCRQTLVCNGDGITFVRNLIQGVWKPWIRIGYTYTDITQLGLTLDNTLEEIITAMANGTSFTYSFGGHTDGTILHGQMPYPYGTLTIFKYDMNRTVVEFDEARNGQSAQLEKSKYVCNYNSTAKKCEPWTVYMTSNKVANPNLLINGDFKVNQRTSSTYTVTGKAIYTVDRWISYNLTDDTTEISVLSNGIKVKSKSGGAGRLRQWIEEVDTKKLVGKTLTFSIKVLNNCSQCSLYTVKDRNTSGASKGYTNIKAGDVLSLTFDVTSDYTQLGVQFSSTDNNGISVEYAKLEIGRLATLLSPKPYSQELADCQRYYQRGMFPQSAIMCDTNQIALQIHTPVTMRALPTLTMLSNVYVHRQRATDNVFLFKEAGYSRGVSGQADSNRLMVWLSDGASQMPSGQTLSYGEIITLNSSSASSNALSDTTCYELDSEMY